MEQKSLTDCAFILMVESPNNFTIKYIEFRNFELFV